VAGRAPGAGSQFVSGEGQPAQREGAGRGRRRARVIALQVLYELDATSHDPDVVLHHRLEDAAAPESVRHYAGQLVWGVRAHQASVDEQIAAAAPAWPLEQMARVDKSILRLAIFEMMYAPDVPPRVAINEAVELAKTFGHETSPRFVNGVLGSIERARRTGA
jgi:N utilization substance protein B